MSSVTGSPNTPSGSRLVERYVGVKILRGCTNKWCSLLNKMMEVFQEKFESIFREFNCKGNNWSS